MFPLYNDKGLLISCDWRYGEDDAAGCKISPPQPESFEMGLLHFGMVNLYPAKVYCVYPDPAHLDKRVCDDSLIKTDR